MFQINITEKGCKTEKIRNLSSEVLDVLLLYLVTDNLEELEWEKVSKLLHAVDKHPIVDLIKHCSSFLSTHLSATNVCDVLVFAETYKNTELKMIAQEFISSHASEIFSSDTWTKVYDTKSSKLAAEILLKYCITFLQYKKIELKMSVQEFISSHASEIFSSDTWTKFMIQNPKLAAEILSITFLQYQTIELKMYKCPRIYFFTCK
ncbi:TD and POZ domain-containing protein 4 [Caerostris extrusa]|uniref:TD and POZ domain-containing protein 4 n=1 Tax=Caerostris extrusa TaxID=172846 RepID=A0AAV4UJ63_CAEEX|nr:TD and POZ domain-containing protein 4 [Caerostris extrusa]